MSYDLMSEMRFRIRLLRKITDEYMRTADLVHLVDQEMVGAA